MVSMIKLGDVYLSFFPSDIAITDGNSGTKLLGMRYQGCIPVIGLPSQGKSFAFTKFSDNCQLFLTGERISIKKDVDEEDENLVGVPCNMRNLMSALEDSDGEPLIIDSITTLQLSTLYSETVSDSEGEISDIFLKERDAKMRLSKEGLDVQVFRLISELDFLCFEHFRQVFVSYNPIKDVLIENAYQELKARSPFVILIHNRGFAITNPLTREFSYFGKNDELFSCLYEDCEPFMCTKNGIGFKEAIAKLEVGNFSSSDDFYIGGK
jgi:hypothetical protein